MNAGRETGPSSRSSDGGTSSGGGGNGGPSPSGGGGGNGGPSRTAGGPSGTTGGDGGPSRTADGPSGTTSGDGGPQEQQTDPLELQAEMAATPATAVPAPPVATIPDTLALAVVAVAILAASKVGLAPPAVTVGCASPELLSAACARAAEGLQPSPLLALGSVAPPLLALRSLAPPPPALGTAAPPSLALGMAAPPPLALGTAAPPSLALRMAASPSLALGTAAAGKPAGMLPLLVTAMEAKPAGTLPLLVEVGATHSPPTTVEVELTGTLPLLVDTWTVDVQPSPSWALDAPTPPSWALNAPTPPSWALDIRAPPTQAQDIRAPPTQAQDVWAPPTQAQDVQAPPTPGLCLVTPPGSGAPHALTACTGCTTPLPPMSSFLSASFFSSLFGWGRWPLCAHMLHSRGTTLPRDFLKTTPCRHLPPPGPGRRGILPSCSRRLHSAYTSPLVAPLGRISSDGTPSRTKSIRGKGWLGPPAGVAAAFDVAVAAAAACFFCPVTGETCADSSDVFIVLQGGAAARQYSPVRHGSDTERSGEEEYTLYSEACAISRPLLFTLQACHAANPELQRRRTTQLWAAYRQARRRPASLQASQVRCEPKTPWLT
ncbi:UNVERIFIED_CONTAM: hypothetical protein FKN15_003831 [Acipenser sinensis]